MSRGGRGGYSPRGSSYRGSSSYRGPSTRSRGFRGAYRSSTRGSYSGYDSRPKYDNSDRYASSGRSDNYRGNKPYREDLNYRDRSPERKRPRTDAYSTRHDTSYGRYDSPNYAERRSYSGDRAPPPAPSYPRREEFRRPTAPAPRRGSGYRGRISSFRGSRGRRPRLSDSSYGIVKRRSFPSRSIDYARKLKINKLRSAIAARSGKKSDNEDEDKSEDEDNEDDTDQVKSEPGDKTSETDNNKTSTPKEKSDKEDAASKEDTTPKKVYIKLVCPHCSCKAITFRKYEIHLSSRTHMIAMKKVALKQKQILQQMRQAQRTAQNELEKGGGDEILSRTSFCPLCKLNYKQRKAVHQVSEAHKNMKKFLMPFCKVCLVTFKSPMMYENHCASIEHLKRKQRMETSNSDESGDEDLENFTTIDSVGDVDGDDTEKVETIKEEPKEVINVGIEKIRKVEAHWCDLCKMYLTRGDEVEMPAILSRHCKQRVHMQRYVRYQEDKDLEERAEKLQRKETAEKEDKVVKVEKSEDDKEKGKEEGGKKDEEDVKDDKMWADVDKDLGDILAEAEDDDDADSKERYDRFKLSEKNGDDIKEASTETKTVVNGEAEKVKEEK